MGWRQNVFHICGVERKATILNARVYINFASKYFQDRKRYCSLRYVWVFLCSLYLYNTSSVRNIFKKRNKLINFQKNIKTKTVFGKCTWYIINNIFTFNTFENQTGTKLVVNECIGSIKIQYYNLNRITS